jgi:hypothetical protein
LFELLLALALLALIAAGLAAATGLGVRLYDRSVTLSGADEGAAMRVRLRSLIAAALPPTQLAGFPTDFEGRADGFAFTTLAAADLWPGAAALRVEVRSGGTELTMSIAPLDDDGHAGPTEARVLAEGLSGPVFAYYDAAATPPGWQAQWEDHSRLPALVRIEDPSAAWPEFTVRPRLGGS